MHIGNIPQFHSLRVLLEFLVQPLPKDTKEISLAQGYTLMEIPTRATPSSRLRLNLKLPVGESPEGDAPPQPILQAMSRLTLYRMQDKARKEVEQGQTARATRRLQHLATHLLAQGQPELAHTVLMEAESINRNQQYSKEGDKRIKYGTRGLLLPPSSSEQQ
jgi:Ca-activated chloride channel family protein